MRSINSLGMLKAYYLRVRASAFARNAFILTAGTVVAQALPILFYPILGRIFSPADFGLLATISAITPIFTILASGMYENAILMSDSKEEAANIVGMIILRSIVVLVLCYLGTLAFSDQLSRLLKEPGLGKWLVIPPLCAFATVIYNCFNEWCVTNKQFVSLSWNKIINTSSVAVSKVGFGFVKIFGNGLVIGDLLGKVFSAVLCTIRAYKLDGESFKQIDTKRFKEVAKKYIDLPRYLMPDQILNNIGGSIHIFFISAYFSNTELGLISMSASLLTVPVTVISSAIKDVFRQRANEEFAATGSCTNTYVKLLKPIAIFGIVASIPVYFILPYVFSVFLGSQWLMAGVYSQILLPMYLLNFISMSLGGVLIIAQKTKISMYWQVYTIVSTVIAFFVGIFVFGDIKSTLYCYMAVRTSAYLLYMLLSYHYSKKITS